MDYILLILGFILLIKGADIFVDGASSLAKKIGIPPVIVGLTIVSLGTSAPELAVSLISSLNGNNDIAIGNVVGSNLFNSLMVLGITAIVLPLIIQKQKIKADFLVNISVSLLLFFLTFDSFFGKDYSLISRIDGIILLVICIAYISYLVFKSVKTNVELTSEKDENINVFVKILLMFLGVSAIVFGGDFVVDSATNIAYNFGMSEKLVGLTIIAMGTSLPELVTSIVAALKGENDIALGNVLGSNIFNILLIIGLSSVISPISVTSSLIVDFAYLIAITLFIFALVFIVKKPEKKLSRFEGAILVLLYIGYMAYIIIRN
ncbi:MAG: calcium/sodium antiporter [Clostridium butyricum]|nr:calcium/sodium antiporter [Clostridium butyricum]